MRHAKVRGRLSAYLERDLAPRESERVARHLAECGECVVELRELEETVSLLRRLPDPEPPRALAESVMARVRAGEADSESWLDWLRRAGQPALALPVAALAIGLALLVGDLRRPVEPAVDLQAEAVTVPPVRFIALEQQRRLRPQADLFAQLARQGRADEVARYLSGAGHPHSQSLASHFEEELAHVDYRPGRRR